MSGDLLEMETREIGVMAEDIVANAKRYMEQVKEIQAEVGRLGTHWTGDAFDGFKSSFDTSYAHCEELYNALEGIARNLADIGEQGAETEAKMMDIMNS